MSKTETPVSQLKINRLTKTQFDGASDLSDTELYAVDPEFTGGKLLKTDSNGDIVESTATETDTLPSQSGQSGKFLTTNGSNASWGDVPTEIPSQSGQSGKYLTTNGTSVSWGSITIPTVNNATLTIQKNGSNVATFTANASSNVTANISVPTQASDISAVASNTAITGATKCKITYDSKGLVTAGADLSAGDIPDLSSIYVKKDGGSNQQTIQLSSGSGTTALGLTSRASSSYLSLSGTGGWLGSYGVSSNKKPTFYNGTSYTLAYTSDIPTNNNQLTNGAGYITSSALSGYQTTANLVTSVSSSSTDTQYPSAKLFYDTVGDVVTLINAL